MGREPRFARLASLALVVAFVAAGAPASASVAPLAGPAVTVALLPAQPDGSDGWYVTPPEVHVTVDADAELGWGWDSIDASVAVAANVPVYLSDAPEGIHTFSYDALSAGGRTKATAQIKTDATAPSRPESFTAEGFAGPGVILNWDDCADDVSGVARYAVFRDTDGPPYTYSDEIASTTATSFTDAGHVAVWRNATGETLVSWERVTGESRYAVRAVDGAGNPSLLAEAQVTGGVFHDLVLLRSEDGSEFSHVATLPPDATACTDPAAPWGTLLYVLCGVDADGNVLAESLPAPVAVDLVVPPAPDPALAPVYSPGGAARFRLTWPAWTPITDVGSGMLSSALTHGPSGGTLVDVTPTGQPFDLAASTPTALWTARVRSEDVAGNVSLSEQALARNVGTFRHGGADRVATSLHVACAAFASADTAVFASSLDFPDALAASALAGAVHGPVILVGRGPLPRSTLEAMAALGVRQGYVVGGTASVERATYASVDAALPGTLARVAGSDRFQTAAAVARTVARLAGTPPRAYVVSGRVFADALSAGPAAYAQRAPILFATADAVPSVTAATLSELGIGSTAIVGGYAAVTRSADEALPGSTRVSGPDRYATSRAFADWAAARGVLASRAPVLVTGLDFPDGLSAAPLAGESSGPVLLTSVASAASTRSWLVPKRAGLELLRFVGGQAAMPESLRVSVWAAVSKP